MDTILQSNKGHRALIIGSSALEKDLRSVLNEYGYFVEHCKTRQEGARKFRSHKQAVVILDTMTVERLSARLFRFFRLVRESTIVLITASENENVLAAKYLIWGAHDIVHLPLNAEKFNLTLSRVFEHQKESVRRTFIHNAFFFGALMLPIWLGLAFLALH